MKLGITDVLVRSVMSQHEGAKMGDRVVRGVIVKVEMHQ